MMNLDQPATALERAIRALVCLRRERLEALLAPDQGLVNELADLVAEEQLLKSESLEEREAASAAWEELVARFGSEEDTWASYPGAAGLVLMLHNPGAREGVLANARMAR